MIELSTKALSDFFWKSKAGQEVKKMADDDRNARRTAAVEALKKLDAGAEVERSRLSKAREKAIARYQAAQRELETANREMALARCAAFGFESNLERLKAPHQHFLRETAGGDLSDFLAKVMGERERMQNARPDDLIEIQYVDRPVPFGTVRDAVGHNLDKIAARVAALSEMHQEAERLAGTELEIADKLDKMWSKLPETSLQPA